MVYTGICFLLLERNLMYMYLTIYIIIIALFQSWNYVTWKKAQGERQVAAYLRSGSLYLFLFLLPIIYKMPDTSITSYLKSCYTVFLVMGYVLRFLMYRYITKSCRIFRYSLRPESKIIIAGMPGVKVPWNPYYKVFSLFIILSQAFLLKKPLVIQQDNYLYTWEVIAFAFRHDIERCRSYAYFHQSMLPLAVRTKSIVWKKSVELYLICQNENDDLSKDTLPFPADKLRFLNVNDISSVPLSLIRIIEDAGTREAVEKKLSYFIGYQGTEPGKRYLAKMIRLLLEKRRSETEYFYELMKLAEFIIHYQSLADYETSRSGYFNSASPVSMGTLQEGIANLLPYEPEDKESYISAVKYLNRICTGKEGSVNRKKLLMEGRLKLVMARNHFIGHGSLSYGISTDFVRHLLTIVYEQASDLFHKPEPVLNCLCIYDVPKYMEQEGGLYLLIQKEDNCAHYLDYASGKFLTNTR